MKIPDIPPNPKEVLQKKENVKKFPDYIINNEIRKFVEKANTEYLYWDEIKYKDIPKNIDLELLWAIIKFIRHIDTKRIKISDVKKFYFGYKITDNILQKLHEFDLNLGGPLKDESLVPKDERAKSLISSTMEEAIASSILEGAVTTRKEAKEMLRKGREPKTIAEKMVLNNYLTMQQILKLKDRKLTPDILLDIHKSMTNGTLEDLKSEGRFRDSNDVNVQDSMTGEIAYVPPDFKLIPKLLEDFCDFANKDSSKTFIHPVVKACILHFLMGYIHPFDDGNGRTARAIFYWYVLSKGYWLFQYMSISRKIRVSPAQYARAYLYTENDENDLTYFINYKIKIIDSALKDLDEYMTRQKQEKEKIYKYLKVEGMDLNSRQIDIIKRFSKNPRETMTVNEVINMFDVVYETARTDLLSLVEAGLLDKATVGKKKLLFLRSDNFEEILNKKK